MKTEQISQLTNFIRHMITAIANVSLYSSEHSQVHKLCTMAHNSLEQAIGADSEISLLLIDYRLVVEGIPLATDMYITRFSQTLKLYGISHVKFMRGIRQQELHALICSLSKQRDTRQIINSMDHIRFGNIEIPMSDQEDYQSEAEAGRKVSTIEDMHNEVLSLFKELSKGIEEQRPLNMPGIVELVAGFISVCKTMTSPMQALATLRKQDEYTYVHSANVCILNLAQAMSLGIDGSQLHDIGIAALLHDIGKLFVPDEILNKPGRLDEAEMDVIRQHPVKGALYLLNSPDVPRLAVITSFEHHMKFNISGYPVIASPDWQLNLCSEMTMISDFFDALRTRRIYRDALDYDEISSSMFKLTGSAFNPALLENFLHLASATQPRSFQQAPGQLPSGNL
jgi:HD-GYP domain-containing protein (c-di-GMP phosphodiesterase class II)